VQFFLLAGRPRLSPLPERELEALRVHATVTTASEDPVGSRSGGGQPPRWLAVGASVRVRVEIMGLIIIRTGWDSPTILYFCDPIFFTRTRSRTW
jgi:hypothetical protein